MLSEAKHLWLSLQLFLKKYQILRFAQNDNAFRFNAPTR